MASQKSNTIVLAVIAVALLGILGVLILENTKKTPLEEATDSVTSAIEDVGNAVAKETGKGH